VIKINLCPIDELENQYWYVPDLAVAVMICLACYFGVDYYLNMIEDEIAVVNQETVELGEKFDQLQPDLERFKTLDADIQELRTKIESLKSITVSRISKYKPIIALEHLHNLSPEGLWYKELKLTKDQTFEITGEAFDNLLLSELIGNLRATESQIDDKSDLRTQVYFSQIRLSETTISKGGATAFPDIKAVPTFTLSGVYMERGGSAPVGGGNGDEYSENTNASIQPIKRKKVGM
jgi:hypothetical protein